MDPSLDELAARYRTALREPDTHQTLRHATTYLLALQEEQNEVTSEVWAYMNNDPLLQKQIDRAAINPLPYEMLHRRADTD